MGQGALGLHKKALGREAPTAEDALKHLLLTLDVEQLYRSALLVHQVPLLPFSCSSLLSSSRSQGRIH